MADDSSQKVTDLKADLKKREIPQAGLPLNPQFIDKLEEGDAKREAEYAASASDEQTGAEQAHQNDTAEITQQPHSQRSEKPHPEGPEASPAPAQQTVEPEPSTSQVQLDQQTTEDQAQQDKGIHDAQVIPGKNGPSEPTPPEEPSAVAGAVEPAPAIATEPTQTSGVNTGLSTPLPLEEVLEDKRKRRRRSQSPAPTPEAIAQKKARVQEQSPRVILHGDVPAGTGSRDFVREE